MSQIVPERKSGQETQIWLERQIATIGEFPIYR
jgi:hypothetical protein